MVRLGSAEANPDVAFAILRERGYAILSQALVVRGVIAVAGGSEPAAVQLQQAVGVSAKPELPVRILQNRADARERLRGYRCLRKGVPREDPGLPIKKRETVARRVDDP